MKGAHDDIAGALAVLEAMGLGRDRRYLHVDGALNATVIPFLKRAQDRIRPSFEMGIDSILTSGHKMIGTSITCGVLVARRIHVDRIARAVAYLKSNDTTLVGSRNGHAVLSIWARLFGHGYGSYAHDALSCSLRAEALVDRLRSCGRPELCNPHALTVVFDEPRPEIVNRYRLAANKGLAHAIVVPNVTDDLLDLFAADYLNWSKWTGA